ILNGTAEGDQFGFSVAGGGDFFGEGGPDLVIGAPGANKVYVYNGSDMDYNITISGAVGEDFGWSVAFAGDFMGVGNDTIAIGEPGSANGTVYLYYYDNEVVESGDEIEGESSGDRFGYSISAGDVDLDGKTDLIVGAPYNDEGGADAGRVYFFRGNDTVPDNATSAPYRWTGPGPGNYTGWAVAHVGFIGDVDPIAVGSPGWYGWDGNVTVVGLEVGLGEVNVTFRVITLVGDALTESNNITLTIDGVEYYLWDGQNVSGYFNKSLSYSFSLTSGDSGGAHRWARAGSGEDGSDPFEGVLACEHHEANITVYYYEQFNNTAGVKVDGECCVFPQSHALDFDGEDHHVEIEHSDPLNLTDLTVSCWFNSTASGGWFRTLVSKYGFTATTESWGLGWTDTNTLGFYIRDSDATRDTISLSAGQGLDGDWHHIVGVASSTEVKLWFDGELVGTIPRTAGDIRNERPVTFGYHLNQNVTTNLDDVRIFNGALSSSDIEDIYNNRYVALGDEVGWWPMNEGEGTTVYDRSGNDNHGTVTNASWGGLGQDVLFVRYTRFNNTVYLGLGAGLTSDYAFIWSDNGTSVTWDETVYKGINQRWHLDTSESAEETANNHGYDWNKTYIHQYNVTFNARNISDGEELSGVEVSYYQFGVLETNTTGFSDWADCGSGYAYDNPHIISANQRWFSRSNNLTGDISSENITISPEYYRQWKVEFAATTEGTNKMTANNHTRVTYDWCELENLTDPIYDANPVEVWVNHDGNYNYTHTSNASTGTHRWYSSLEIDANFQGTVENADPISCTYYEQWYVEFGATTAGTNDMTADNHTRVTYDWGTSTDNLTAPIYDDNPVSVWLNDQGNYNYTRTSNASTGTHRWYSSLEIDTSFLGTIESADPISCTYYEQWYVEFGATTVGTNAMNENNHTRVTYSWGTSTDNLTAPIYDGNSVSVWVNDGGLYNYTQTSNASTSVHRWYSDDTIDGNFSGSISVNGTITCTYYEQWYVTFKYNNTLGCEDSPDITVWYINATVQKMDGIANEAGNSYWCDDNSEYNYTNPHVITPDEERWYSGSGNVSGSITSSVTISPDYYRQFYITVQTSGGYLNETYYSTLYWNNLSVQEDGSIYDASSVSAWMDFGSEFYVDTPVSGPGDRNLRFVCDDHNSTANESRTHTFLFHAEFDHDVSIDGPEEGAEFGYAVSGTADFDSTGHGDIIIGAPGWDEDTGRTYMFYTEGDWENGNQLDTEDSYAYHTGENTSDRFGHSLSNPGDVTGDGFHSVLMGAPYHAGKGRTYLYEPGLLPNVTLEFTNHYKDETIAEITFNLTKDAKWYGMEVPLTDDEVIELERYDHVNMTIRVNEVQGKGEIKIYYGSLDYDSYYQLGGEEDAPMAMTLVVNAYKNGDISQVWVTEYQQGEQALVKANITALDGKAENITDAEISLVTAQGEVAVDYMSMGEPEDTGVDWKLFNATILIGDDPDEPYYVAPGLYKIIVRTVDSQGLYDDVYGETNDRMLWIRVVDGS
ncbi:MAG: LamG-like jellyroll fold domain-containing protein, partial [Thermoplasmata archaeon]